MAPRRFSKIDTLFPRCPDTHKVLQGSFKRPEFGLFDHWDVTEKIDGTNVRIHFPDEIGDVVAFYGRTENAQLATFLLEYLQKTFTPAALAHVFPEGEEEGDAGDVTLFGEGYGPRIQKGGGNYRQDVSFRLFDVLVGDIWLRPESVQDVAEQLHIQTAPDLGCFSTPEVVDLVRKGFGSQVAMADGGEPSCMAEGIVARAPHGVLDRQGRRIMMKLKTKDFPAEEDA